MSSTEIAVSPKKKSTKQKMDQITIEEDDDDACYLNGASETPEDIHSVENGSLEDEIEKMTTIENGKLLEDVDECFETEEEIFNDDGDEEGLPNECDEDDDDDVDDDKSLASDEDDEGVINESCISVNSAVESLESESTVVKKSVKKSVRTSKTTSKKQTISTTESSSITSSKAESFENSFSNGSVEVVEQHHVVESQAVHQESIKSSKSLDSSSGKEVIATIQDSADAKPSENGEKKKLNGKKKTKKSKKSDEKENISVRSSFSKFDALQKKNMQNLQNGRGEPNGQSPELEKKCHACGKVVFQMEQVKAEKKFWHKNCFRCSECSKQLNADQYQSHEGVIYCKPHFKTLFAPKAVEESNEPVKPRKLEMIIRESQPIELPPDVARSSDKADLGLEELQQLNVRQRFQVFENAGQQEAKQELDKTTGVKRSTSILSKLARFQAKGMDVGVVDDSLNGICYEHSSSEEEEEFDDDENQEDIELIRAKRAQKEKPMSFKEMHDIKSKFETGDVSREERREERKQELQNIRSRLFMGKQAKIKEMYQQAVADSEQTITASGKKSEIETSDNAKSIKERFEKGEIYDDIRATLKEEEMSVFEQGIGKQSRSLFLELDATASKSPIQQSPSSATLNRHTPRQCSQTFVLSEDIVRSGAKMDDVQIETADIVSKFKFFETYKPAATEKKQFRITPPRDGVTKLPSPDSDVYRDPHIARSDDQNEQDDTLEVAEKSHTASKMLSMFRQLEEHKEQRPVGPKPLKRFTPPPDEGRRVTQNDDSGPEYSDSDDEEEEEEEEEESEEEQDPNYVKSSHKNVDEFLKAAQSAERAKQLREKFEKWEKNEIKKEMNNSSVNLYEPTTDDGQMETAKSLRARFEQMQQEEPKLPNARVKVNRFV